MGHQWLSQPLGVWQTLCPQFLCQIPNESGPQAPPTHFLPVSVSFGGVCCGARPITSPFSFLTCKGWS